MVRRLRVGMWVDVRPGENGRALVRGLILEIFPNGDVLLRLGTGSCFQAPASWVEYVATGESARLRGGGW